MKTNDQQLLVHSLWLVHLVVVL